MQSVDTLTHRFEKHFQPGQANMLAQVIHESYTDLVKTSDFNELKGIVADLGKAQKRTEIAVQNLARQVGGLSESFGGSLEDFAIDIMPEILEQHWGLVVESAGREEIEINGIDKEFDLVIRGTIDSKPVIVLGEVKSNLTEHEVHRFLKITSKFKEQSKSEVRTIFFGYRAKRAAREAIRAAGAYMIFTHGKIV